MKIDELFQMLQTTPISPDDTKMLLVGASDSMQYLNAITNMQPEDMTKVLYALYTQNNSMKIAIDALRGMIEQDLTKAKAVVGKPANTFASDLKARQMVEEAMNELGAIYVVSDSKKC